MIRVEVVVNVVSVRVAKQSLCLLLLRRELSHRLRGQIDGPRDSIKSQVELIQLLAGVFEAEFNRTLLSLVIAGNLIEGLVQVDDLSSHLIGEAFNAHHTEDDKDDRGEDDNH